MAAFRNRRVCLRTPRRFFVVVTVVETRQFPGPALWNQLRVPCRTAASMSIKTINDLDLQGRRVFIRVDFNVPLTPARGVADATRIKEALPTIKHAMERGARLILASHLGRPKGKPNPEYSLEPVAAALAELLGQEVVLADEPVGDGAKKVVVDLRDGGVALLENLRFHPGEEAND